MTKAHRRMLTQRLEHLTRRLRELDQPAVAREADDVDAAVAGEEAEHLSGRREWLLREAAGYRRALQRIVTGEYETCADCSGPIARRRLEALPTTTTCVGCAALRERAATNHRGRRPVWSDEEDEA